MTSRTTFVHNMIRIGITLGIAFDVAALAAHWATARTSAQFDREADRQ